MNGNENLQDLQDNEEEVDIYGDDDIVSRDAKVPRWLKAIYMVLPIWGIFWFFTFLNGSCGWLDRGYWNQLQRAALTTFPSGTIEGEATKSTPSNNNPALD